VANDPAGIASTKKLISETIIQRRADFNGIYLIAAKALEEVLQIDAVRLSSATNRDIDNLALSIVSKFVPSLAEKRR